MSIYYPAAGVHPAAKLLENSGFLLKLRNKIRLNQFSHSIAKINTKNKNNHLLNNNTSDLTPIDSPTIDNNTTNNTSSDSSTTLFYSLSKSESQNEIITLGLSVGLCLMKTSHKKQIWEPPCSPSTQAVLNLNQSNNPSDNITLGAYLSDLAVTAKLVCANCKTDQTAHIQLFTHNNTIIKIRIKKLQMGNSSNKDNNNSDSKDNINNTNSNMNTNSNHNNNNNNNIASNSHNNFGNKTSILINSQSINLQSPANNVSVSLTNKGQSTVTNPSSSSTSNNIANAANHSSISVRPLNFAGLGVGMGGAAVSTQGHAMGILQSIHTTTNHTHHHPQHHHTNSAGFSSSNTSSIASFQTSLKQNHSTGESNPSSLKDDSAQSILTHTTHSHLTSLIIPNLPKSPSSTPSTPPAYDDEVRNNNNNNNNKAHPSVHILTDDNPNFTATNISPKGSPRFGGQTPFFSGQTHTIGEKDVTDFQGPSLTMNPGSVGIIHWVGCRLCGGTVTPYAPMTQTLFDSNFARFLAAIFYPNSETYPDPILTSILNSSSFFSPSCTCTESSIHNKIRFFRIGNYDLSVSSDPTETFNAILTRPVTNQDKQELLFNRFVELQTIAQLAKQIFEEFAIKISEYETNPQITPYKDKLLNLKDKIKHERTVVLAMLAKHGFTLIAPDGTPMMSPKNDKLTNSNNNSTSSTKSNQSTTQKSTSLKPSTTKQGASAGSNHNSKNLAFDSDSEENMDLDVVTLATSPSAMAFLSGRTLNNNNNSTQAQNAMNFAQESKQSTATNNNNNNNNNKIQSPSSPTTNPQSGLGQSLAEARVNPSVLSGMITGVPSNSDLLAAIISSIQYYTALDQFDINKLQIKLIQKFLEWNKKLEEVYIALLPVFKEMNLETKNNHTNGHHDTTSFYLQYHSVMKQKANSQLFRRIYTSRQGKHIFLNTSDDCFKLPPASIKSKKAMVNKDNDDVEDLIPSADLFFPRVTADDILEHLPTIPPQAVDLFRRVEYDEFNNAVPHSIIAEHCVNSSIPYHGHLALDLPLVGPGFQIPVKENEPGSIISYALATVAHANYVKPKLVQATELCEANPHPFFDKSEPEPSQSSKSNGSTDLAVKTRRHSVSFVSSDNSDGNSKAKSTDSVKNTNHKNSQYFISCPKLEILHRLLLLPLDEEDSSQFLEYKSASHSSYINFQQEARDFRVRIYYPAQFFAIRSQLETCGGDYDFIQSLSVTSCWNVSGGKSGSTFHRTQDQRYVLKFVADAEINRFNVLDFSMKYFQYMASVLFTGQPSALNKILGVFKVYHRKLGETKYSKLNVFVMPNLFYSRPSSSIITQRIYDLKGSERNRYLARELNPHESKVKWDTNFLEDHKGIPVSLDSISCSLLRKAIQNDSAFLAAVDVMDYSLLAGFYAQTNVVNGNTIVSNQIIVGIIDFVREYTWDKVMESVAKSAVSHKAPTVIGPKAYKERFREAVYRYFIANPRKQ